MDYVGSNGIAARYVAAEMRMILQSFVKILWLKPDYKKMQQ
jgi:hypothetical protein